MRLSGRAALVTGGASGIGAAVVDDLRRAEAEVAVADRERADVVVDLREPGAAGRMVEEAVAPGVEYAVAKAGLLRLTTALGAVDGVRVNCVCPHTVATEAVRRALESRSLAEIAPPPPTILDVEEVVGAVRRLVEDDSLAGRVLLLVGGEAPRYLDDGAPAEGRFANFQDVREKPSRS